MNNLFDLIAQAKSLAGIEFDAEEIKALKEKRAQELKEKANEVMNTGAQYFGQELIPVNVLLDPIWDMLGKKSSLLPLLPGNHGSNMPTSAIVPIVGEVELFKGKGEWTTGAVSRTPANNGPATDKVTITQGQFIQEISISKEELNYGPAVLEAVLRDRLGGAAGETIDALLINADSATTNNINGTYDGTAYYAKQDAGIRKVGIANTAINVGTLDAESYLDVAGVLDDRYSMDLDNLLYIEPAPVYRKSLALPEVITNDKFGPQATIHTGVLSAIWNVPKVFAKHWPRTDTTGVVSTTASDNTKGSFACIYRPAIQFGFGQNLIIELKHEAGYGDTIVATFDFGFDIVNNKAGLGKTVGLGVNVTI